MGIRITTWNVNGIRNPFGYQPWRDRRSFDGMFDILEADIVVFQETKIQRKDLRDDMVLVPGWDCYFSLPKHKKGYSGVVIYTRNSTCAPIRAEEGITGVLAPPNSSTSFRELPEYEQIGGYPTPAQLSMSEVDAITLDSEGRSVILEFPAFVLVGTYCPAARDETRDDFRLGFLNVLDARLRNLVAMGKRVIWTGDLNISRSELDTANAEATMRKNGMSGEEYVSTPSRRLFNHLLLDGKVIGERDEGREEPILWDICRGFHPRRPGMFTCWEQKVNARPGNHGARIDYVLCTQDMKDWFCDSNIQEGLMGSDHCPVYAVTKDHVTLHGQETPTHMLDLMNPIGMFKDGKRLQEYSSKNYLPMSGKLIPEFDRRRNIKDMFTRKPSMVTSKSSFADEPSQWPSTAGLVEEGTSAEVPAMMEPVPPPSAVPVAASPPVKSAPVKRQKSVTNAPAAKRPKSGLATPLNGTGKGQQSLKGFFKPKSTPSAGLDGTEENAQGISIGSGPVAVISQGNGTLLEKSIGLDEEAVLDEPEQSLGEVVSPTRSKASEDLVDPIVSKESWGKLFTKPIAPKCEHEEPCKTMLTKKKGANCGRSFWMCARPLGPSGQKERGTQWRCSTFIWCSDWNGSTGGG